MFVYYVYACGVTGVSLSTNARILLRDFVMRFVFRSVQDCRYYIGKGGRAFRSKSISVRNDRRECFECGIFASRKFVHEN